MVSFLWYIGLSNFYMIQSIYLSPVACLFNKSLQYPDQRKLIPVSFPPDSFRFYFFHLTLSSIWKLFWFREWSRALTYFFSMKTPFSHSNGCGFYLEADGESLKKAEPGRDAMRFALRRAAACGTWRCTQMVSGCGLSWSSYHTPYGIPIVLEGCLWLWEIKEDPWTLQELIREMHQEFAPIQHLPEAGWRHLMCVRDWRGSC